MALTGLLYVTCVVLGQGVLVGRPPVVHFSFDSRDALHRSQFQEALTKEGRYAVTPLLPPGVNDDSWLDRWKVQLGEADVVVILTTENYKNKTYVPYYDGSEAALMKEARAILEWRKIKPNLKFFALDCTAAQYSNDLVQYLEDGETEMNLQGFEAHFKEVEALDAKKKEAAIGCGIEQAPCKMNIALLGNPRVGKSLLLNALLRKIAGKSFDDSVFFDFGQSVVSGLTETFEKVELEQYVFVDTPGLDDVERRVQAGKEIQKALQLNGFYKIIFVITLEELALKPADLAMMRTILEAAPDVTHVNVLINKIDKEDVERLKPGAQDSEKIREAIRKQISEYAVLSEVFYFPKSREWRFETPPGKLETLPELPPHLYEFIMSSKGMIVRKEKVTELGVDGKTWEDQQQLIKHTLKEFHLGRLKDHCRNLQYSLERVDSEFTGDYNGKLKKAVQEVSDWLEKNGAADIDAIEHKASELEKFESRVREEMQDEKMRDWSKRCSSSGNMNRPQLRHGEDMKRIRDEHSSSSSSSPCRRCQTEGGETEEGETEEGETEGEGIAGWGRVFTRVQSVGAHLQRKSGSLQVYISFAQN